jgi:hypothetical protein
MSQDRQTRSSQPISDRDQRARQGRKPINANIVASAVHGARNDTSKQPPSATNGTRLASAPSPQWYDATMHADLRNNTENAWVSQTVRAQIGALQSTAGNVSGKIRIGDGVPVDQEAYRLLNGQCSALPTAVAYEGDVDNEDCCALAVLQLLMELGMDVGETVKEVERTVAWLRKQLAPNHGNPLLSKSNASDAASLLRRHWGWDLAHLSHMRWRLHHVFLQEKGIYLLLFRISIPGGPTAGCEGGCCKGISECTPYRAMHFAVYNAHTNMLFDTGAPGQSGMHLITPDIDSASTEAALQIVQKWWPGPWPCNPVEFPRGYALDSVWLALPGWMFEKPTTTSTQVKSMAAAVLVAQEQLVEEELDANSPEVQQAKAARKALNKRIRNEKAKQRKKAAKGQIDGTV